MANKPLSKSGLLKRLVRHNPDLPQQVCRLGGELILDKLSDSLAEGRSVSIRGFGRIIPRIYKNSTNKKLGMLFHASPQLLERLNSVMKSFLEKDSKNSSKTAKRAKSSHTRKK
jgi:nucleoid DNA-binding protein